MQCFILSSTSIFVKDEEFDDYKRFSADRYHIIWNLCVDMEKYSKVILDIYKQNLQKKIPIFFSYNLTKDINEIEDPANEVKINLKQ